jgi:hypothetical protein
MFYSDNQKEKNIMRTDEVGNECPETLGEYLEICTKLGGDSCNAVTFLNKKIEESAKGKEEIVIESDRQMREILIPLLFT